MPTLDQVLDIALQLPIEQQTMLIEIIRHRQIEARRAEMAAHAQQAIAAFHQGQLTPQSADTAITELRQFLSDETELDGQQTFVNLLTKLITTVETNSLDYLTFYPQGGLQRSGCLS